MENLILFESFVQDINEAKAEKGLMHKLLNIPQDKKISDVYTSGKKLAEDLMKAVKDSKTVPAKDAKRKTASMLAFAANWPSEGKNTVIDKALRAVKNINESESKVEEGFWSSIFGDPTVDDATRSSFKSQGWSHMGRDEKEKNYVVFNGKKFYPEEIEYDDVYSTKDVPRIENGKLIVANPAWSL